MITVKSNFLQCPIVLQVLLETFSVEVVEGSRKFAILISVLSVLRIDIARETSTVRDTRV